MKAHLDRPTDKFIKLEDFSHNFELVPLVRVSKHWRVFSTT